MRLPLIKGSRARQTARRRVVRHVVKPEKDLSLPAHDRYEPYAVVYHRGVEPRADITIVS